MAADPIPPVGPRISELVKVAQEVEADVGSLVTELDDYRVRWDDRRALEARLRELGLKPQVA